jgi:hypothetical protein
MKIVSTPNVGAGDLGFTIFAVFEVKKEISVINVRVGRLARNIAFAFAKTPCCNKNHDLFVAFVSLCFKHRSEFWRQTSEGLAGSYGLPAL